MKTAEALALRIAGLQARQQQLEARERERKRKQATHAAIVAGSLLLRRPDLFGLDSATVRGVLAVAVQREHDRRALGLDEPPPGAHTASTQ